MERLTKKCDVITQTTASVGETEYVVKENKFGKAINKLGELEDIMEKYNIEYPNALDFYLQTINNLNTQNANLRKELAELKQKAIVPKFRIGQEVWFISDPNIEGYIARYSKVRHIKIEEISISSIFIERGVMYAGGDWAGISESELFATKEEAEQKLAEIKGKKHE